jgi:hypothetical protein
MAPRKFFFDPVIAVALVAILLCLAACGRNKSPAADTQPASKAVAQTPIRAQPTISEEPSEEVIRAAFIAPYDEINRKGGAQLVMSGARSKPFEIKVESYRKMGCTPVNNDFRCEAELRTSYPGTELPEETFVESIRFRKDAQGQWTNK